MNRHRRVTAGLAVYGACTAVLGLALVAGPRPAAAPRSPSRPARSLSPPLSLTPSPPARSGDAVPSARVVTWVAAGSPFTPTELVLPKGTVAPVVDSGVHPDGSLVVPDDPAVVGWWNGGARAGDAFGSVVVAGHVDSARFGIGVMVELASIRGGEVVELRGDGRRQRYRVTDRRSLPQADLVNRTEAFRQDGPPRLVLITCGGRFDPVRHGYEDNVVVTAEPSP